MMLVRLFHIILVSGLFFYVAVTRTRMPLFMYPALVALGALLIVYHLFKLLKQEHAWVNYIHIFLIGPLLLYIGFHRENTSRKYFELLLMLAFASFGYHAFYFNS
jgi:hypothetical protein